MKCTECNGTGQITMTLHMDGNVSKTDIDCVDCDGSGELTQEEAQAIQNHKDDWCDCGNPSEDAYYVPDGKDSRCLKHHYRCYDCDGIYQIG